jgi:AraC family transcriptional regulator, arabinose operon regulatory protein
MYIFDHGQKRNMDFSLMIFPVDFENVQVFRSDPGFSGDGLSVSEFGKQRVAVDIFERRLNDYAAVFIENGQGVLSTERGGTMRVVGPALFWLFPNELHSYGPDAGSVWQERWALFRGTLTRPNHLLHQ